MLFSGSNRYPTDTTADRKNQPPNQAMKVQCPCGTKYAFDITPEMARTPVQLVCQVCGLDLSEPVNQLIREELASIEARGSSLETNSVPTNPPPSQAQETAHSHASRVHVDTHGKQLLSRQAEATQFCLKHPGYVLIEHCRVCNRPMCQKCMELFGYVCSPLCKARAEDQGIEIPVYAHQRDVVEAKNRRKVLLGATVTGGVLVGLLGLWFWYAWFGSVPHPKFSARFDERGFFGQCKLVGKDQLVILHGGGVARYDLKTGKQVWSKPIIDREQIRQEAKIALDQMELARQQLEAQGEGSALGHLFKMPTYEEMVEEFQKAAEASLALYCAGDHIWVGSPGKLTCYDWESGQATKEIVLEDSPYECYPRGQELLLVYHGWTGEQTASYLNLASGEIRTERLSEAQSQLSKASPGATGTGQAMLASAIRAANRPADPAAVAARVQKLPIGARLALPALLAAGANQQRALAQLDEAMPVPHQLQTKDTARLVHARVVPDGTGFVQFTVRLIERRFQQRQAMKDRPATSALDSSLTAAGSTAAVNEILNEMQRERSGGIITEDVSRYLVTLGRTGSAGGSSWTGEVTGPPEIYTLQTVNVLASRKTITVFDKSHKKLWEAKLNYDVMELPTKDGAWEYGQGPCIERAGTLYVLEEGTVWAFDLGTGQVRWQIPTVGARGVFFDADGMLYVNTTTASHDTLKYPLQIDVNERRAQMILKIDPRTGKQLWCSTAGGWITCVSGKYLYSVESYQADEKDTGLLGTVTTGFEIPSHVRIRRIHPKTGKVIWEHYQQRCPLDLQIEKNSIYLLFRKELQVLKFVSL